MHKIKEEIIFLLEQKQNDYRKLINSIDKKFSNRELKNEILTKTQVLNQYKNVSFKERIYCILNDIYDRPSCKNCNNKVNFHRYNYAIFCSGQCVGKFNRDKIGKSNKENYQKRGQLIKEKFKKTCLERYGETNVGKVKEIQEKAIQTRLEKTGYKYSLQNPISKKKFKKTCLKRYGVENPSQFQKTRDKAKQTNLQKYGVEHALQNEEIKNKMNNTILKRYGVDNVGQLSRKTYSKSSQKLFWSIYARLPMHLKEKTYFQELNKEFDIFLGSRKQYLYDFVISNIKICIEFNGDVWHANPNYYNGNEYHPIYKEKLNKEVWKQDEIKQGSLKQKGYSILIIWDSEYKNNHQLTIDKCINFILNNNLSKEKEV